MPLASIIKVFQRTASDKPCEIHPGKKTCVTPILQDKVFRKAAIEDFISLQSRLDHPPQFRSRGGLCNLIKHETSQWIALVFANRICPSGTHSTRKGLLAFANILSTPGHVFKEPLQRFVYQYSLQFMNLSLHRNGKSPRVRRENSLQPSIHLKSFNFQ